MKASGFNAVLLLVAGACLISIGQFAPRFEGDQRDGVLLPTRSRKTDVSQAMKPVFELGSLTTKPLPGRKADQRLVSIVLRNRSAQPVKILGATSSCQRMGCWTPLNLPVEAGALSDVMVEFQANWTTEPAEPLPITLYVGLSSLVEVELHLLPHSAIVRPVPMSE